MEGQTLDRPPVPDALPRNSKSHSTVPSAKSVLWRPHHLHELPGSARLLTATEARPSQQPRSPLFSATPSGLGRGNHGTTARRMRRRGAGGIPLSVATARQQILVALSRTLGARSLVGGCRRSWNLLYASWVSRGYVRRASRRRLRKRVRLSRRRRDRPAGFVHDWARCRRCPWPRLGSLQRLDRQ